MDTGCSLIHNFAFGPVATSSCRFLLFMDAVVLLGLVVLLPFLFGYWLLGSVRSPVSLFLKRIENGTAYGANAPKKRKPDWLMRGLLSFDCGFDG